MVQHCRTMCNLGKIRNAQWNLSDLLCLSAPKMKFDQHELLYSVWKPSSLVCSKKNVKRGSITGDHTMCCIPSGLIFHVFDRRLRRGPSRSDCLLHWTDRPRSPLSHQFSKQRRPRNWRQRCAIVESPNGPESPGTLH